MIFRQVMATVDGTDIVAGATYEGGGRIAVAASSGDLYTLEGLPTNALGYGDKTVFAQMRDGRGTIDDAGHAPVSLELANAVASASQGAPYEVLAQGEAMWGAEKRGTLRAIYISPSLSAGDQFAFWKTISWTQPCVDAVVEVAVKTADTLEELLAKDWDRYFYETCQAGYGYDSGTLTVVKSLDYFNLRGAWFMFKVLMETDSLDALPYVSDLSVSCGVKHAVFFFSNKIRIESGTEFGKLIVTASATEPSRTEAVFAVGPGGSVDWKDYQTVTEGRLHTVPASWGDRMRVGIRLSSFDDSAYATVHEFALSFDGGQTENKLNEDA